VLLFFLSAPFAAGLPQKKKSKKLIEETTAPGTTRRRATHARAFLFLENEKEKKTTLSIKPFKACRACV
jgi:hypothetical protein